MIANLTLVPLFRPLPAAAIANLASAGRTVTFPAGSVVVHQGDPSDSLFVVLAGRVRVVRQQPGVLAGQILAELGPHEVIGEMGLLDRDPRSATVEAAEDTTLYEIGYHTITRTVLEHPAATAELLRTLSRRLRSTDDLVDEILRRGDS